MRLGVLDVGSSTVHLLVVDARPGGHPDPVRSHKTALHLAELPGVSAGRAAQLLAGAVVAHEAMPAFDLAEVQVCPWALREGVIPRRLDELAGSAAPTSLGQR